MAAEICPDNVDHPLFRVVAHHRHESDLMTMRSPPEEDALVRDSMVYAFPTPPASSLGSLSGLPLEIFMTICECLPIASYFRFRQVNRLARQLLSSPQRYQSSTDNCMEALRAALRTRLGLYFTMPDFYKATFTPECHVCGQFGNFMFLPHFKRCCWSCLGQGDELRLTKVTDLAKRYEIPAAELLEILPTAHVLVGRAYPLQDIRRCRRRRSKRTVVQWVSLEVAEDILGTRGIKPKPGEDDPSSGRYRRPQRLIMATPFAYVDRDAKLRERGVFCKGCRFVKLFPHKYNQNGVSTDQVSRAYTRKGFLQHFRSCVPAQGLWEGSREGAVELDDEPLWLKNGGYPPPMYSNWDDWDPR